MELIILFLLIGAAAFTFFVYERYFESKSKEA